MRIVKPFHKKLLLFFAVYLFFAVTAVAFDHHSALPSKTCAICFMSGSLFSAIGQAHIVPQVYDEMHYVSINDSTYWCCGSGTSSGILYRGPPLS